MLSESSSPPTAKQGRPIRFEQLAHSATHRMSVFLSGFRRKLYGPITHVKTNSNAAALTFDDGPHPENTVALLNVLKRYGAKATFFMIGQRAQRYPDLVKMVAEQGHAVANHSLTHAAFPTLSSSARVREIEACHDALRPYATHLFRPPFGLENMFTHKDAKQLGYDVIKWSLSVDDWRDHPAGWIADRMISQLAAGSIILLHDNRIEDPAASQKQTVEALEKVLAATNKRFSFCTVPELLKMGTPMSSFHPIW